LTPPADPAREPTRIHILLLDIEGTTTPVDFVYRTLFPYARARVEEFLARHWREDAVAADLEALEQQRATDAQRMTDVPAWREDSPQTRTGSAAAYARWLMDHDRKVTPLKSLQGKIWQAGYASGELRGQVYPDVAPAFLRWRQQGRKIAIFSSGSVLAQKLLFAHSTSGDLTPHISNYFDTTTGPKQEEASYRRIAATLGVAPEEALFLSDVVAELDAAGCADMATRLCIRGGSPAAAAPASKKHASIHSFDEVFP